MTPVHLQQVTISLSDGSRITRLPVGVAEGVAWFVLVSRRPEARWADEDWNPWARVLLSHPSGRAIESTGGGGGSDDETWFDYTEVVLRGEPLVVRYVDDDGETELGTEVLELAEV